MREVLFYKTKSERCPVEKFLSSLTSLHAKKVTWVLNLIEELEIVPTQYFKKLAGTKDIWEVRVQIGNDTIRFLGFLYGTKFVVLTNGFMKKSKKTPLKEIRLAERRKRIYLHQRGER